METSSLTVLVLNATVTGGPDIPGRRRPSAKSRNRGLRIIVTDVAVEETRAFLARLLRRLEAKDVLTPSRSLTSNTGVATVRRLLLEGGMSRVGGAWRAVDLSPAGLTHGDVELIRPRHHLGRVPKMLPPQGLEASSCSAGPSYRG